MQGQGSLPVRPARPPWSAWDMVLAVLGGFVFAVGAIAIFDGILGGLGIDPSRNVLVAAVTTIIYLCLLLALYLIVLTRRRASFADAGLIPVPRRVIGRMGFVALGVLFLNGIINAALSSALGDDVGVEQREALVSNAAFDAGDLVALLVAVAIAAPLVEELLFRGLLYRYLRARAGEWPAALTTAFLFAVVHFIPPLIPALFVLGVVLARVAERYGSIVPAIALHAFNNTLALLLLYVALNAT